MNGIGKFFGRSLLSIEEFTAAGKSCRLCRKNALHINIYHLSVRVYTRQGIPSVTKWTSFRLFLVPAHRMYRIAGPGRVVNSLRFMRRAKWVCRGPIVLHTYLQFSTIDTVYIHSEESKNVCVRSFCFNVTRSRHRQRKNDERPR